MKLNTVSQEISMHDHVRVVLGPAGKEILGRYVGHVVGSASAQFKLSVPLWELFKIFGSEIATSFRLPFDELEIGRAPSKIERAANVEREALRSLAIALGLVTDYTAPEDICATVEEWSRRGPPATPTEPGPWWLNGEVVTVERLYKPERLVYVRRNGHRSAVEDVAGWGGPALRDPRVVYDPPSDDGDGDIPFCCARARAGDHDGAVDIPF